MPVLCSIFSAKRLKPQFRLFSTSWWVDKQIQSIHLLGCDSATRRIDALTQATMWMSFETTMPSERRQKQEATWSIIPFIWNVQNQQIQGDRKQIGGCQGLGRGVTAERTWGSLLGDGSVGGQIMLVATQHCECTKSHHFIHSKTVNGYLLNFISIKKYLRGLESDRSQRVIKNSKGRGSAARWRVSQPKSEDALVQVQAPPLTSSTSPAISRPSWVEPHRPSRLRHSSESECKYIQTLALLNYINMQTELHRHANTHTSKHGTVRAIVFQGKNIYTTQNTRLSWVCWVIFPARKVGIWWDGNL